MGSNMAENHPVGFQWVVEARERGAHVFHVDPRFTRPSAMGGEQSGHGGHGGGLSHGEPPEEDLSLQNPNCVFQIVKRHYARYTPEFVAEACGCSVEEFLRVAKNLCENSGRDRTSAFVY